MSEDKTVSENEFNPPLKDPWKMFRGVMAGALILQAIIVLLALPVVAYMVEDNKTAKIVYVVVLGLLLIVGAGFQGRSWAIKYNLAMQVLAIGAWWVHPALGACGILFAALWAYMLHLRSDIKEREAHGLLPGQRDFGQGDFGRGDSSQG